MKNITNVSRKVVMQNTRMKFAEIAPKYSVSGVIGKLKGKSEGLLKGKTAKVFATCDAPKMIYNFSFFVGINLKKILNKTTFDFCGIKLVEFKLFDKFHRMNEDERKNIFFKKKT
ncbi:NAD(P)H-dependent oxidoreductase, partial [Candidatus Gracilibacteria bacterium]|nr:NAD(P)H-dependent oxidoreductase [Candidatus Gracilibacteria bacterium]